MTKKKDTKKLKLEINFVTLLGMLTLISVVFAIGIYVGDIKDIKKNVEKMTSLLDKSTRNLDRIESKINSEIIPILNVLQDSLGIRSPKINRLDLLSLGSLIFQDSIYYLSYTVQNNGGSLSPVITFWSYVDDPDVSDEDLNYALISPSPYDSDSAMRWRLELFDDVSLDIQSHEVFTFSVLDEVNDEFSGIPEEYSLYRNFPNPINPPAVIRYALPKSSDVSLVLYNIMGQEVMREDEKNVQPGYYSKIWNGTNKLGFPVESGVYLLRLQAGNFVQTRKLLLLK